MGLASDGMHTAVFSPLDMNQRRRESMRRAGWTYKPQSQSAPEAQGTCTNTLQVVAAPMTNCAYCHFFGAVTVPRCCQVGARMRLQLLQLLHPLQVVELPREAPEPALRCWVRSGVPGWRVLVVGGDGSVGWVLTALDAVRKEHEQQRQQQLQQQQDRGSGSGGGGAEGSGEGPGASAAPVTAPLPPFCAPPVAVLPLGTGELLVGRRGAYTKVLCANTGMGGGGTGLPG